MAHLRVDFFSEALSLSTSMTVLLPQQTSTQIGLAGAPSNGDGAPPVLYLLHGLSDDDTTWLRRTSIERYAAPRGLAVVMPQVHRSFYADEAYGGRFWTFLSEELPALVKGWFNVTDRPERTFVAGLSMGGYGAMRWVLSHPDRFGAAACFSGAVDLAGLRTSRVRPEDPSLFERVFGGDGTAPPKADLYALLAASDPATVPPLYLSCGTEDPLYEDNHRFAEAVSKHGLDLTSAFPPGSHEWGLWDREIATVLDWLPLS